MYPARCRLGLYYPPYREQRRAKLRILITCTTIAACSPYPAPPARTVFGTSHSQNSRIHDVTFTIFVSAFIDNTETSTFIQLYRNRRFFDLTKAVGVQIRTTRAHLHAETSVEHTYTLPIPAQLKCSGSYIWPT